MPKQLRPGKWPHFMEKRHKPKDAQYHSNKILGQLYDKVETVNFKPQYEEPFDKRILRAYALDDATLKSARQLKTQYDDAMKRICNQQEVKTEFEIWSTFVLSKPRVGSDYKLQEEIGRISESLKDHWRSVCIEKAGGKDFSVLGPFVAAMYKVTKEEIDIALAECRTMKIVAGREVPKRKMEPKSMPLMSFPWLFEKELGRIATGIDISEDLEDLGLTSLTVGELGLARKSRGGGFVDMDDFIQQEDGVVVHRGEELDLFRQDIDSNNFSDDGNLEVRESHDFVPGESGELVLATEFQFESPVPEHLRSDTGVEDVVPRTILDGFDDPRVRRTCESGGLRSSYFNNWRRSPSPMGNHTNTRNSPLDSSAPAKPTPSSMAALSTIERESLQDVEERIVERNTKESSLEKLAKMVDQPASSDAVNPAEDLVEEEVVSIGTKELPMGFPANLEGESVSQAFDSEVDALEEEIVKFKAKESALEKLARMMGS